MRPRTSRTQAPRTNLQNSACVHVRPRHVFFASPALLLAADIAVAGNVILSPALDIQAGYEHNRRADFENAASSPFIQFHPGLDVTAFGEQSETALRLDSRRTQYTKDDLKAKDESTAFLDERWSWKQDEFGVVAGGGRYRDEALPGDDHTFWQLTPYASRMLASAPAEINVKCICRQNSYDTSAYASTSDRVDTRLELRPGIKWDTGARAVFWAEIYAERNTSSAAEAEYTGAGGAIGCNWHAGKRTYFGVWAESGTRPYALEVDGEARRDAPSKAGVWSSCRLRPWLDIFLGADLESFASTQADAEYAWWSAQGGIRVVMEHEITRK